MALILSSRGVFPQIPTNCFLAPNATVVGQVVLGQSVSVWFQAVIRGDVSPIHIGDRCNIQDAAIIHGTYNKSETVLEDEVSVGHGAILHGCYVGRQSLIGMQAVVMDHVKIGENCLIGAGALIPSGVVIPDRSLVVGRPGKIIRELSETEIDLVKQTPERYLLYSTWYDFN